MLFGGVSIDATKKSMQAELLPQTVLIDTTENTQHPYYVVLLDEWYNPTTVKKIKTFMKANGIFNYKAITALNCYTKKEDLSGELVKFYRTNKSDYEKHLEGAKAILTVGAALYSITESDDLMVNHFYDIAFNNPYFYSPDAKKYVFPIDSFHDIFEPVGPKGNTSKQNIGPADTYKTHFAEYVIKRMTSTRLVPIRTPDPILIHVKTMEQYLSLCKKHTGSQNIAYDLETSGFCFVTKRIGCFTCSFDGVTGYYIPWSLISHSDKTMNALNDLLKSCKTHILANGKFDIRFLWQPHPTNCIEEGYIIIEHNGVQYKIMDSQQVKVQGGYKPGKYLSEDDTILDTTGLAVYDRINRS